jgi:hypothetical protein
LKSGEKGEDIDKKKRNKQMSEREREREEERLERKSGEIGRFL